MEVAELKALIEEGNKAFAEFRKANDARLDQVEAKGKASGELVEKVDKINSAIERVEVAHAKRIDDVERRVQTEGIFTNPEQGEAETKHVEQFASECKRPITVQEYRAYKKAQVSWLRRGPERLTSEEHAALSVGNDSQGGHLVTPDVSGRVVTRQFLTSPIRSLVAVQGITTDALEGTVDRGEFDSGWVGETEARPVTATSGPEKWRIPVHEQYAKPEATQSILDDASIDIEAWLAGKIADKFTRRENTAFVTGDGISKPRGFASYATAATADDARAWGTLEHVASGVSAGLGADPFFDFLARFKDQYLPNFRWLFHRLTLAAIRKLKDGQNNYLWEPRFDVGEKPSILGYQYERAEDMPQLASNALAVAGGDFKQGYQIVDRIGIRLLRDPYSNKPYVQFYTTKRVGGDVIDFEALKFIKCNA